MRDLCIALLLLSATVSLNAEPMKYTQEQLSDPSLLKTGIAIPLNDESERGLHVGIYGKDRFKDLREFCLFITNISSMSQLWYAEGDLDEAYEWYVPDDSQAGWIDLVEKKEGRVKDWIRSVGLEIDSEKLPDNLGGTYLICGDKNEFLIAGYNDESYFELCLSDLVL